MILSKNKLLLCSLLATSTLSLNAQENVNLDTISVTATKIATGTKEVSQSIAVVDEKTIEDKNILNIQEAIENIPGVQAESSTNSPSPRLIIRGAGLKARYGVREIMVMKDGVPMTDPDSFTRFDYIDMQDVKSVEVQKGPGSINASNATGGVIQLITKSVFDDDKNRIKIGAGNDGQKNINLKLRDAIDENNFVSATFSKRAIDNSWRDNNDFDSTQASIKYGHIFEDEATLETELSYTESNMNLPSSMTASEFTTFKSSGEQHNTSSMWQHSARDSKIIALNAKYEKEVGDITYKPRFYMNAWEHFHPVTGMINDSDDNKVFGTDLEANYKHKLFENKAVLVAGVTWKTDRTRDAKKYEYKDFKTETATSWPFGDVNVATLSNERGDLAQTEDSTTTLYGAYAMESFSPTQKINVDVSARADKLSFDIDGNEIRAYDWSTGGYKAGAGDYSVDKSYTLLSSKVGATYKVSKLTNIYASVARANQAPTGSEIESAKEDGINLDKTISQNYEVGIKTRTKTISYDIALYQNDVKDEIIQVKNASNDTVYDNAGKTQKRGFEFNGAYKLNKNIQFGGSYAYSDFKFKEFSEVETIYGQGAPQVVTHDRKGNYLPYIPKNQYALYATYKTKDGFKSRITTKSWGSYYMDNANSEKYEGYKLVTDLMVGYEKKDHSIQLNVKNITNKYYAMQASKSLDGDVTYKAAAPRSAMVTYTYKF